MANNTTKPYRNTFSGSVGAGMGSLLRPGARRYYILEHKITSRYHRAGEAQEIIVDNIEIGRDSHCQVRFDESFTTVSRHHAGIVKEGDMWKLVQISKTNSTLLNGHPVKTEWYLQSGDEIQLSINGPKLGFIIPTGKRSTVGSIGLTRRLSLFRQQALRPYKTAIACLTAALVVITLGLGGWNWKLHNDLATQSLALAEEIIKNKDNKQVVDSLAQKLAEANQKIAATDDKVQNIGKASAATVAVNVPSVPGKNPTPNNGSADITACYPYTYLVICCIIDSKGDVVTYTNSKGQELPAAWSGTGFLLSNGYFVTAHHMVNWDDLSVTEDGRLDPDGPLTTINSRYYAGEWRISFVAVSPNGDKINVVYTAQNNPFHTGRSKAGTETITDEAGRSWIVCMHSYADGNDWAYMHVSRSNGLPYDPAFSMNMPPQTRLTILGFPANMDMTQHGKIAPDVSEAITARQGLEDGGWVRTSNENTDHGNSGGPVFAIRDGVYKVVGLCSGANAGSDESHRKGRIVPIGAAFR